MSRKVREGECYFPTDERGKEKKFREEYEKDRKEYKTKIEKRKGVRIWVLDSSDDSRPKKERERKIRNGNSIEDDETNEMMKQVPIYDREDA